MVALSSLRMRHGLALTLLLVKLASSQDGENVKETCTNYRKDWHAWTEGASAQQYIDDPLAFYGAWYVNAAALANCMTSFYKEKPDKWAAHMEALVPDPNNKDAYILGQQPVLKAKLSDYGADLVPLQVNAESAAPGTTILARRKRAYTQYKGICCLKPIAWSLIDEDGHKAHYACRENAMLFNFAADLTVSTPEQNDAPFKKKRTDDEGGEVGVPDRTVFPEHGETVSFLEDLNDNTVDSKRGAIEPKKVSFITEQVFLDKVNKDEKRAAPCEAQEQEDDMFLYGVLGFLPNARKVGADPVPLPWTSLLHNEERPIQLGKVAGPWGYYVGIRFMCKKTPNEEDQVDFASCKSPEFWAIRETTTFDKTELRPLKLPDWKTPLGAQIVFTKIPGTDFELYILFAILGMLMLIGFIAYRASSKNR